MSLVVLLVDLTIADGSISSHPGGRTLAVLFAASFAQLLETLGDLLKVNQGLLRALRIRALIWVMDVVCNNINVW